MLWPTAGFLLNEEPLPLTLESHISTCWPSEKPSLETERGEQGSFRVHTEGSQKTWNVVSQQKHNSKPFKKHLDLPSQTIQVAFLVEYTIS